MTRSENFNNITSGRITAQEAMIAKYPWYQQGKIDLLRSLNALSRESAKEKFKELAVFLPNAENIYWELEKINRRKPIKESDKEELDEIKAEINSAKKIIVVGGDYFSKEELDSLKEETISENIKLPEKKNEAGVQYFNSPIFYTETLAEIYATQGYFTQALDVYSQLILLYPEKSTYFALLIDGVKAKMNSIKE